MARSTTAKKTATKKAAGAEGTDRQALFNQALADVTKKYGAESARRLGDSPIEKVNTFSTTSLSLDVALGVGGLPAGRIIEIYGPEASGKTTLTLHAIASAQAKGGNAVFIDAEHALDPEYAANLGVDVENLVISQPSNGEEALDVAEAFVSSGAVDLVVVDSVAALTPKAELEGDMEKQNVGLQARMMSKGLRKITASANQNQCTVIFINQLREKIGVFFGSPETTTGGKALKFYASVRLDIRRIETLKDGANSVGSRTRVKVVKNKVAPPFKQAEFDIIYGEGISREGGILDAAVEHGLMRKAGAWFSSLDGEQLGQGKENTRQYLKDNPDYTDDLERQLLELLLPKPTVKDEGEEATDEFVDEDDTTVV